MNCKNKKTGHYVYSTFSPCPVFINNLMVCLRTRLRVGNLLLRRIHETGKYFSIYSHQHSWLQGNGRCGCGGCHHQFGLILHADWLLTPCADWPWQAFRRSRGSTGNDVVRTAEEGRFDTGRRSKINRESCLRSSGTPRRRCGPWR